MRTTVEIDNDLALELKEYAHREGTTLRASLNRALRRGLHASGHTRAASRRYRCPAVHMGHAVAPSINMDKAMAAAFAMEDAETARELEARK